MEMGSSSTSATRSIDPAACLIVRPIPARAVLGSNSEGSKKKIPMRLARAVSTSSGPLA
jgi:hypothetical protein